MGVQINRHGPVAEVVLDWPASRNALGPDEGRALRMVLLEATALSDVGAIVVSATGTAFCAGGNLREIASLAARGEAAVRDTVYGEFQGIFRCIRECPVPFIAAVDGPAVGFGCDLALAGNVTFVGASGWLAQGWIRAGLVPATGGTLYVSERAGPQAVWRLLAADRVDGPTAEAWGLAIACEDARESALGMAARLASLPGEALRATRELSAIADAEAHLEKALEHQVGFLTSPEFAARARGLLGD